MTVRENRRSLVDIINYDFFWPVTESQDAVYGFTHSHEILNICADMLPPHVVTPVEKDVLEDALANYVERRGVGAEEEAKIRAWLGQLPDNIAIIERRP
ncbi:MAG: hypothetical protein OXI54_12775 [Chloroflexota bacterium]|nr:hypothetical protein [Chloroflexota bacterium]